MNTSPPNDTASARWKPLARILLRLFFVLLIIFAGNGIRKFLIKTAPKATPKELTIPVPLVVVQELSAETLPAQIEAMGLVKAAREIELRPRVSGEIVEMAPGFVEGGRLAAGDKVLGIDPRDFILSVTQLEGRVAQAEFNLKVEQGQQEVARQEWEMMKTRGGEFSELSEELALRKPHLKVLESALGAARAELDQARSNLARTSIKMPFDGLVLTRNVNLGSVVNSQGSLARIVDASAFWIEATLPLDRLGRLHFAGEGEASGSRVSLRYANGAELEGKLLRLLGDLEPTGRMARVLIEVRDPLAAKTPLLLGDMVQVVLEGEAFEGVYRIPRTALRDPSSLWLIDAEGLLQVRDVQPLWHTREDLLIAADEIQPGERLILSNIPAPVPGMKLNVKGETPPPKIEQVPPKKPGVGKGRGDHA